MRRDLSKPTQFSDKGRFYVHSAMSADADDDDWEDNGEFTSYADTMATVERLSNRSSGKRYVTVYELASFKQGRSEVISPILFWWNELLIKEWDQAPVGRGVGLTESKSGAQRQVDDLPATEDDIAEYDSEEEENGEDDEEEYVKVHCENCGLVIPLYEAREYSYEKETGRSEGVIRSSGATTRFSGRTGSSHSHRTGGSRTNRTSYKTVDIYLCEECYDLQVRSDFNDNMKTLVFIGLGILALIVFIGMQRRG